MADVQIGGVRLHVQRLGSGGVPVVFLHGLVMDNLSSWYFTVANTAAQSVRVVLYDYRGHGRSERPTQGYGLDALVDELLALLDHEDIPTARLVGHSFGGTLALAAAMRHPDRVHSLLLLDPHVPETGWGVRMAASFDLGENDQYALIADRFQDWAGRHSEKKRSRLAKKARFLVEETTLVADIRASHAWPIADFSALPMPVRLLTGTRSDVRDQSERLMAAVEHADQEWFEGTHSILWEQTDAVKDAIRRWLDG